MMLQVKLFARARDLAGVDVLVVPLPAERSVAALRAAIGAAAPDLASLLPRCAIALDNEFARDDALLHETSEVALLPPVSGG